jgi:cytoskeletal protein CcmA (bactofilin family)
MFSKAEKQKPFAKAEQPRPAAPVVKSDGTPSIISANLHIVGNLKTEGEIQIDGLVDGDVSGQKLTVGGDATVNGEIVADEVLVRGAVNGRIRARSVQLAKSAKVMGDILHEILAVEAGAHLEGHCRRADKSELTGTARVETVKEAPAAPAAAERGPAERLSGGATTGGG